MNHVRMMSSMNRDDEKELEEIKRIQSSISSSSDTIDTSQTSIDPLAELAETHLLLEENSFPRRSSVVKDGNSKRIDARSDMLKREEQQPQKAAVPSNNTQPVSNKITNAISMEQPARRTVTFDDERTLSQSISNRSFMNPRLSGHDSIAEDQEEKESDVVSDANPISFPTQDLYTLLSGDEYIPGGFANLDQELEEELLNDYADEFDDQTMRRNQHVSSIHSIDHLMNISRSPIELWQRARMLIALHLYQIQNKAVHDDPSGAATIADPTMEKVVQQQEHRKEQKVTFGLSIIRKYPLDTSREYQCVDFYDVEQGYIIMCNTVSSDRLENQSSDNKLLVYAITKNLPSAISSVEFDCAYRFHFLICIPIYRIMLGFVNLKAQKSLMILIGDASRKGLLLSKQEVPDHISSILYIHETATLFLGCTGRVLSYNTQPLQYTSQPLFLSELGQLPFQPMEPILHLCQIFHRRSIGILSNRYFVLWQYAPTETCLLKFCNPYRYDFVRCHYIPKYDYIILAFLDGFILVYQLNQMKQIRRYQYHWKIITDLKSSRNETILISSSMDQTINIWNMETLQHLCQYKAHEEIFQIDVIEENVFYYRTAKNLILFQLNLHTLLFAITNNRVTSLKLIADTQQTARLCALLEDQTGILISPVSGCCLTYVPNLSKKPIKQILHDISRSSIYSLQFNGEIILYQANSNPCVAEYKIHTKSEHYAITCMTLINPMRTHLVRLNTRDKSLEKQMIFFGHANGYISLFQGDRLIMSPILAHRNSIVCLETSRTSLDKSNIFFNNYEILLSCSLDRLIYLWDITINKSHDSIELIHLLTIEQEKNPSLQSIKYLSMIDNFLLANYSDQNYLHIWQLLNIAIRLNDYDQWGIVEHPAKGKPHHGPIQAVAATSKFKLFASSDTEGCLKIWDNTNSLLREIYLDQTLCAMEFLPSSGELLIAYQNNIHLILPENYLLNLKGTPSKQQIIDEIIAEDNRLEVIQPFSLSYELLPSFDYRIKTHHSKKRLQRFERQLAGRYAVVDSDDFESDHETSPLPESDHLSMVSDDPNWSELAEDVKDILRMKKSQFRQENK